jgi:hypothetical protein
MKNTPGLLQSCPLLHVEGARLHLLHAITDGYCLSQIDGSICSGNGGRGEEPRLRYTYCGYSAHESVSFIITKAMGTYAAKFIPVRYSKFQTV